MMKLKLLTMLKEGIKYFVLQIVWQWLGLIAQIIIAGSFAKVMEEAFMQTLTYQRLTGYGGVALFALFGKLIFDRLYADASFEASATAKLVLREKIYEKLLRIGSSYKQYVSELMLQQLMLDDIELSEFYYGKYAGRFVFAIIGPVTIFAILMKYNLNAAFALLMAVAVIFVWLMLSIKFSNLKNISRGIVDLLTFIAVAIALIVVINQFLLGHMQVIQAIMFIMLSTTIVAPMRQLEACFTKGLEGAEASERIYEFLNSKEPPIGKQIITQGPYNIAVRNISYTFNKEEILKEITIDIPGGKLSAISGATTAEKNALLGILTGQIKNYQGAVYISEKELKSVDDEALMSVVTWVFADSYLFPGTVRENLLLGNRKSSDEKLTNILKIMHLAKELTLNDDVANLTVGQKQRLLVARALLKNSNVYVFDEVDKGADKESGAIIYKVIAKLTTDMGKTVVLITSKDASPIPADRNFAFEYGHLAQEKKSKGGEA